MENLETMVNDTSTTFNGEIMQKNFDAGLKITAIGMAIVFGVLTILYVIIKIMGRFAKKKGKEANEEN